MFHWLTACPWSWWWCLVSLTARWKCWLPGCSSKPYCLQHWCVFLSSVTSSRLTAAANLYLTQTLTASRETGRKGAAPLERVNSATGRGQVGLIYKWGAELSWGVFVCERVSTYDELVSTVSGWPGRREIITGPAGVCESPSPELPVFVPDTRSPWTWRVSPTKPNWNFSSSRLGWLGQAGPARSKWENILLQSIFFCQRRGMQRFFYVQENPLVSVLSRILLNLK